MRGATIYDVESVIEVSVDGRTGWIAANYGHYDADGIQRFEYDSVTFELGKAHVFETWYAARNTVSRLRCGYPQWPCEPHTLTDSYRQKHLKDAELAAEAALAFDNMKRIGP